MWKRILTCLLAVTLLGTAVATGAIFEDTEGLAEAAAIDYLVEKGLLQGTDETHFSPDETLTRAQAVAMLGRMALVTGQDAAVFQDVPENAYYRAYLGWAYTNGLVQGVSADRFDPAAPVTHQQLATLLTRYLAWLGRDADAVAPTGDGPVTRAQAAAYFAALDQELMARVTTQRTLTADDGVKLTGKLDLPAGEEPVEKLVLFVNGSGPNTYDNHRESGELSFNYYDLFAQQFSAREVGFFRWNTRGVTIGEEAPLFAEVDEAEYQTYLPATSVSDIGEWITALRRDKRLKNAEVYLLGWSEGTIIAPLAAQQFPGEISGLLLAGYCNDRMDEIFDWQQTGGSSMVFYTQHFDADGNGQISPAEYRADPYGVVDSVLGGLPFDQLDLDRNGALTAADFALMLAPNRQSFYDAVERDDDQWLRENYPVQLTSAWFKAHQQLAPNRETLLTLDLPITIFHGTADANCDVAGAYAIRQSFLESGKQNLTVHIYEGYDHDLLYTLYLVTGAMPQAFEDIFQSVVK